MDREFDLSAQVSIQSRLLWSLLGAIQIANGSIHLLGGEHLVLGAITLCFGLLLLPGSILLKRINRFAIVFSKDAVSVVRGLFASFRVEWDSLGEIKLYPMSIDIGMDCLDDCRDDHIGAPIQ